MINDALNDMWILWETWYSQKENGAPYMFLVMWIEIISKYI